MGLADDRKHPNLARGSKRAVSRNVLGLRQNLVGTGAQTLGHEAVDAAQPGIQPARADTTGILPARARAVASRFGAPDNWQKRAVADTWGAYECADVQLSVQ